MLLLDVPGVLLLDVPGVLLLDVALEVLLAVGGSSVPAIFAGSALLRAVLAVLALSRALLVFFVAFVALPDACFAAFAVSSGVPCSLAACRERSSVVPPACRPPSTGTSGVPVGPLGEVSSAASSSGSGGLAPDSSLNSPPPRCGYPCEIIRNTLAGHPVPGVLANDG